MRKDLVLTTPKKFAKKNGIDYLDVLSAIRLSGVKAIYKEVNITLFEEKDILEAFERFYPGILD